MVRTQDRRQPSGQSDAFGVLAEMVFEALLGLLYAGVIVAGWLIMFPMLSLPVAAVVGVGMWQGWPYGALAGLVAMTGWVSWAVWWPRSWDRWVWGRIRFRWLRWWRYTASWKRVMAMHQLTVDVDGKVQVPGVGAVVVGPVADLVDVHMVTSQTPDDWTREAEALSHAWRAVGVRVGQLRKGWVRLRVVRTDILTDPVPLSRIEPARVDLEALPIGRTELGRVQTVPLLGAQLLVAGAMGSGKGSVTWSLIAAAGPLIRARVVQVWYLDPKGGMEAGYARDWFARFAYDNGERALAMLQEAAAIVQARGEKYMTRRERKITPSVDEPLIVLIIDEFASLTTYFTDKKIRDEVTRLLSLILTQSRAVAVPVIGCLQDPSKEVLALRQLFPYRLGLRMTESTMPDMVFGHRARDRGAECDLIPKNTPGIGYVQDETGPDIERFRAYWVSDDDIDWIIHTYPSRHPDISGPTLNTGDGPEGSL
ncbi:FtsK/SpoIIIE domain-containing protein [Nocardia higoensis]|uniref:FtsK/SpoIIIE domain-containing protein n=1 Tax=Nocardia higoensis TaxID=228599 RepID=UPI0012F635D5|nr:FtsK/SpoIIIE domain-containing protein [Nocardia higoensis]